ncbi:MAG: hypothetical protein GF355_09180 [Candidatus Eisenbacteria bacterium]|nr:hypothetical protein [Candidatus Eisenbacteria bacterium]
MDEDGSQWLGCTLADNRSIVGTGGNLLVSGSAVSVTNSIVAFAVTGGGVVAEGPEPVLVCCDGYGNNGGDYLGMADPTGTNGNISADPLFCDPDHDDYHLAADSPCLPEHNDCGVLMRACGEGCPAAAVSDRQPISALRLLANRPNPFHSPTEIRFELTAPDRVTLSVFDAAGRRVATLLEDAAFPAGVHRVPWRGVDPTGAGLPAGV